MTRPLYHLYRPIFRCRLCGRTWTGLVGEKPLPERECCLPQPTAPHLCENGDVGVGEVVGWRPVGAS